MAKFDREYIFTAAAAGGGGFTIGQTATKQQMATHINFHIEKDDSEIPNMARISIWNLAPEQVAVLSAEDCVVKLYAGYNMSLIFVGAVTYIETRLDGVDRETLIEAVDGRIPLRDCYFSVSYIGKISVKKIIGDTASKMGIPLELSYNAEFYDFPRGFAFVGKADGVLDKLCASAGLQWHIQNGILQIKMRNDTMSRDSYLLSSDSGLIGIPKMVMFAKGSKSIGQQIGWEVEYQLNGALGASDYVRLESKGVQGYFRVRSITMSGDNVQGDWLCRAKLLETRSDLRISENSRLSESKNQTVLRETVPSEPAPVSRASIPQDKKYLGEFSCENGDPVNVINGGFTWSYTDLELYGAQKLTFSRNYNSSLKEGTTIGTGWRHSFDYTLVLTSKQAKITTPSGYAYNFTVINGIFTAQEYSDVHLSIIFGGYKFTDYDKTEYIFNTSQKIAKIRDIHGNETNFTYTGGFMTQASNRAGTINFTYTGGRVTRILDNAGRSVSYNYDISGNLICFKNADGDSIDYKYDSTHNLTEISDFNGNTYLSNVYRNDRVIKQYTLDQGELYFDYNSQNSTSTFTNANGNKTVYHYDRNFKIHRIETNDGETSQVFKDGRLISSTDFLGNTTCYEYDSNGNRTKTTYPDGLFETAAYNAKNQVIQATARDGSVMSMTYDLNGNLESLTDAAGNTNYYEYDIDNNLISTTDALGNKTAYEYDSKGNCVLTTDALDNKTAYVYDGLGRLISKIMPNGATIDYEYTSAGKLLKITDSYGNEQLFTVNGNGYNTTVSDFKGNISSTVYNAMNKPVSITNALGNGVSFSYDSDGNLISVTDALGNISKTAYDFKGRMTSSTDALDNTWHYAYDGNGSLIKVTDPLGGEKLYDYNALGLLTKAIDEAGNETDYTYNANGKVRTITDANDGVISYSYNENGQIISVVDQLENKTSNTYDADGNMLTVTDPLNNTTIYEYDELGRVSAITDPLGGVTSISYDANGNIASTTDAEGNKIIYSYDLLNRLVSHTDAENNSFRIVYDENGNVISKTDPRGNSILYEYDAINQLISVTDQTTGEIRYSYDANGNRTSIVDQNGAETKYAYNATGKVVSIRDALGNSISFEYDALGRVTSTFDANGNVTKNAYTANSLLSSITDATGNSRLYEYDAVGNLISAADPLGNKTTYVYDAARHVISVMDALGSTNDFEYNANGKITSVTDKNGNITSYDYDANGNIIQTTDAAKGVSYFEYDGMNRLIKATLSNDGKDQVTLYEYDGRGLVTKVVNASNNEKLYVYDGNGNMVSQTDEDGNVTNYVYDARNLVESILYTDGRNVNFAYNAKGELVQIDDWTGSTNFTLDLLGRITSVNDSNNKTVSYSYDAVGNKTSIVYPDNSVVQYTYNVLNRLTRVTDPENAVTSYTYDAASRLTCLSYQNGRSETYSYDALGQLLKTAETINGQKSTLYQYEYDPMGNIISEFKRDSTKRPSILHYPYDAMNRLTKVIDPAIAVNGQDGVLNQYEYDSVGNITREFKQDYSTGNLMEVVTNIHNNLNQLTSKTIKDELGATLNTFTYLYDNRGNLVSETDSSNKSKVYSYDSTNRMVLGTNANGETSAYTYNGLGYLVNNTKVMFGGTVRTAYLIDYTSAYQDVLAKYVGNLLVERNIFGLGKVSTKQGLLKSFIQSDRLGSDRIATDINGAIVGFADLDEWGNIVEKFDPNNILNNFTNHEFDDVLGVYYAKARFYDPATLRMLSPDPVKGNVLNPQTMNHYSYVDNNPINHIDPDGMIWTSSGWKSSGNIFVDALDFVFNTTEVNAPNTLDALNLQLKSKLSAEIKEQRSSRPFPPKSDFVANAIDEVIALDYFTHFYACVEGIDKSWIAAILTKEISTLDPTDTIFQDNGLWPGDPTIGYAQSNVDRSRKNENILRDKGLLSRDYLYDGKTDAEIRGILLDKNKSPHVVAIQLKAVLLNNVLPPDTDPNVIRTYTKEETTNTFAIYNNNGDYAMEYGEKAYRYYEIWEWYYAERAKLTP